jgi:uncharacterized membrane protein YfcA
MEQILVFVLVGFMAQMIDGALGMAYGVSANSFLLAFGVNPAIASASVHAAEVVTTAISGFSHFRLGNTEKTLMLRLVLPGMLGAILGAYILTAIPSDIIKPLVSIYLLVMGALILVKAFRELSPQVVRSHLVPLGLVGGFLDAIGGGGWGPIVTTTLVARGHNPRFAIGSVNATEFFITLSQTITFILVIGLTYWQAIVGLAIGGAIAAPLAAILTKRVRVRTLMILVGILIMILSLRTIYQTFLPA